jgi:hypothetical protein
MVDAIDAASAMAERGLICMGFDTVDGWMSNDSHANK